MRLTSTFYSGKANRPYFIFNYKVYRHIMWRDKLKIIVSSTSVRVLNSRYPARVNADGTKAPLAILKNLYRPPSEVCDEANS